jgi:hypothetical protein
MRAEEQAKQEHEKQEADQRTQDYFSAVDAAIEAVNKQ